MCKALRTHRKCGSLRVQEVVRPLQLDERMIALAGAISIDFDYFSQHSHGPGKVPIILIDCSDHEALEAHSRNYAHLVVLWWQQ